MILYQTICYDTQQLEWNSTKIQLCALLSCSSQHCFLHQHTEVWCSRNEVRVQNCSSEPRSLPAALTAQDMALCQVREVLGWHRTLPWCWDLSLGSQGAPGPAQAAAEQFCVLRQFRVNPWAQGAPWSTPRQSAKVTQVEKFNNPALSFHKLGTVAHTHLPLSHLLTQQTHLSSEAATETDL